MRVGWSEVFYTTSALSMLAILFSVSVYIVSSIVKLSLQDRPSDYIKIIGGVMKYRLYS